MNTLRQYIDIHTHNLAAGPQAVVNLPFGAEVPPEGAYSVGIHPWDAADATEADLQRLERLAANERVVAIGEAGLDALRGGDLQRQEAIFRRQVAISEALGKPMIIHSVRTANRLIELRKELAPKQVWIMHGFRGKPQQAEQLLRAGFDISLGEKFNPATLAAIPPARLWAETDTSTTPITQIRQALGLA